MRSKIVLALAFGMGLATGAQAQSVDCDNAMTQRDMNACAATAFEAADTDLNAAYTAARSVLRTIDAGLPANARGAEIALRDAQRAWITYRDLACKAEGFQVLGGSAQPLFVLGCLTRLTQQRSQDLWDLAAGIEG